MLLLPSPCPSVKTGGLALPFPPWPGAFCIAGHAQFSLHLLLRQTPFPPGPPPFTSLSPRCAALNPVALRVCWDRLFFFLFFFFLDAGIDCLLSGDFRVMASTSIVSNRFAVKQATPFFFFCAPDFLPPATVRRPPLLDPGLVRQ